MCVTHNNPMRANQSTTLQIMKANHCKASQSKTMQSITAQTKRKRCISQRAQVRHTNHIKVLQSKTNQGKPMYKSGSSCASHLRAILLILPTRRQQIKAPHARQTCQSNLNNTNVLKQRAQVRHTNHSKAWQSKASTGKPMYKSPPSCAPHLRTSPIHLPLLVRVSLDKLFKRNPFWKSRLLRKERF